MSQTDKTCALVWFRRDLRLNDNPALELGRKASSLIPLYIDDTSIKTYKTGGASRWWLHHSLHSLSQNLVKKESSLILRKGDALEILESFVKSNHATHIYWNRCYHPEEIARDKKIMAHFKNLGIEVKSFNAYLIKEPWDIQNKSGKPYQIFGGFYRAFREAAATASPDLISTPKVLPSLPKGVSSDALDDWHLLPTHPNWAKGLDATWQPGEQQALKIFRTFVEHNLNDYTDTRNIPSKIEGTSSLSPYLHWGEISLRKVWNIILEHDKKGTFLQELGWREFAHHLLYYFPHLPYKPLQSKFENFPWKKNTKYLKAWQQGLTGYPIVDAGMRQLWQIGWMHNRVRMITGSFLVKHLLLPWQQGADWFWDTLVDADLASNYMNWQWVAGCGVDASPFFRIFNPMTQGAKFDPEGIYVRRWVPELELLPNKYIHQPWEAPIEVLEAAKVKLGKTYPKPIVSHTEARKLALEGFAGLSKG